MQSFAALLPQLPLPHHNIQTAAWPVWRESQRGEIKFTPVSRKERMRIWAAAQRWDRRTHEPGRHGGVLGRTAIAVLRTLLFDFLNHKTGRLDPSIARIGLAARVCRRAAATALQKLRRLGIINWVRRCEDDHDAEGRYRLRQRTNAYGTIPPSQWIGAGNLEPPDPPRDTLGYPPPIPEPIEAAAAALLAGDRQEALRQLELDPQDKLARALASWGKDFPRD